MLQKAQKEANLLPQMEEPLGGRKADQCLDRALMIVATRATEMAGMYLRQVFRQPLQLYSKQTIHDPVTVHDHYVENRLHHFLGTTIPNCLVLGEETGEHCLDSETVVAAGKITISGLIAEGLRGSDGQVAQKNGEATGGEVEAKTASEVEENAVLECLKNFSFDQPDPFGRPQIHFDYDWEDTQKVVANLGKRVRFIVDPIDGTANFAHGSTYFATSIGVELDGKMVAGAIYSPFTRELYCADAEQAYLIVDYQATRITADGPKTESAAVFNGYWPYRASDPERSRRGWERARKVAFAYATVHSPGSGALDLASVAAGFAGVATGTTMRPWDVAAGIHLVRVAGGTVTTYENKYNVGYPEHLRGAFVAASRGLDPVTACSIINDCAADKPLRK